MLPIEALSWPHSEVKINEGLIGYDNKLAKDAKNYPGNNLKCE